MSMEIGASKAKSDINITPLIDVLLVLLIIFMVITPILQKGFDTQVPQKAQSQSNPPSNVIVLQIDANGGLSINKKSVTFNDLGDELNAIYSTRPDKVLFVDGDDNVRYEDVIKAVDIAKSQGKVETIGFVLN
ncbi:MAG: biopolymer transporter ExbD [Thermoanaerobaculaceae bacterium]|nr:biopolymer transporter ExbD [Thermoanaerobaculaceae bacterium]